MIRYKIKVSIKEDGGRKRPMPAPIDPKRLEVTVEEYKAKVKRDEFTTAMKEIRDEGRTEAARNDATNRAWAILGDAAEDCLTNDMVEGNGRRSAEWNPIDARKGSDEGKEGGKEYSTKVYIPIKI